MRACRVTHIARILFSVVLAAAEPEGDSRPRVAVLLSGALRTLPTCAPSLQQYVVESNPGFAFDFFAYLTIDDGENLDSARKKARASLPKGTELAVYDATTITKLINRSCPGVERLPAGEGTARGKAANIVSMFYGIAGAGRLLIEHGGEALQFPHSSPRKAQRLLAASPRGGRYRLILRVRPDLRFCSPLDLSQALVASAAASREHATTRLQAAAEPEGPATHAIFLPWYTGSSTARGFGLDFDQIAVGPPDLMARYVDGYGTAVCEAVAAGDALYPERMMWRHLTAASVQRRKLLGFNASLARGGGGDPVSYADPFAKLRIDFPDLADSVPLPSTPCAA